MRGLSVTIDGDIAKFLEDETQAAKFAVTAGVSAAGAKVKTGWRKQVKSAGLGNKLANTIRNETYPTRGVSARAASLVWSKAPNIIDAHERGLTIRSKSGFWLAIPLPAAGKSRKGGRITPLEWERRNGMRLRFIYRHKRSGLLVADGARLRKGGTATLKKGRRRKSDGILRGETTVPIFVLVPQVKLKKRLDFDLVVRRESNTLPGSIVANWRDPK